MAQYRPAAHGGAAADRPAPGHAGTDTSGLWQFQRDGVIQRHGALASAAALVEFEIEIARHDEVMACYLMTGVSDYLLSVALTDLAALGRFILERLSPIPGVEKIRSRFALKQVRDKTALPLGHLG